MIKKYLRDQFFGLAKRELAIFLEEHEEELIYEFREQIRKMDKEIPDEQAFIDVRMVPLGETILRASLMAIRRFLRGEALPTAYPREKAEKA